ncbi:MAG: hypothetical protein GX969_02640 [Firmicutes bacterium]|nr:hypothetical protein [Bacillota bacterium]
MGMGCLLGFFGILIGLIGYGISILNLKSKANSRANEIVSTDPDLIKIPGSLVGGNHPLLGSIPQDVYLLLGKDELTILRFRSEEIVSFPLECIKAEVSIESAVSAAGIALFGILALGAKQRLLVLEVDDKQSQEQYKIVLKSNNDSFLADKINKQRYNLLIARDKQ